MKLGKVAGIVIKINLLFLLLAGIYVYLGMGWEVLSITVSLMMHEMAHTLVAVFSRIRITEIELLPFGGQARIEDFTGLEPENEIYIALAGPLVSLSLAGLFYFLPVLYFAPYGRLLFNINLLLGLFNLLPALPLDGGRILRAVLSVRQGYKHATQLSARLGLLTAAALTVDGMYLSVGDLIGANYIVIGFFLFWAARREQKFLVYFFMRYLVHKKAELAHKGFLPARHLASYPETPVKKILAQSQASNYLMVVLLDREDRVIDMLGEARLIETLLSKGPQANLADCCQDNKP